MTTETTPTGTAPFWALDLTTRLTDLGAVPMPVPGTDGGTPEDWMVQVWTPHGSVLDVELMPLPSGTGFSIWERANRPAPGNGMEHWVAALWNVPTAALFIRTVLEHMAGTAAIAEAEAGEGL